MRKTFFRFLFYAVCMAAVAYSMLYLSRGDALWLDVQVGSKVTSEFSPVEQLQHACLLACACIFLWIASRDRLRRPMAIGWTALFSMFLIRELDFVFDLYLVDNLWQVGFAIVLAFTLAYLVIQRERFALGWRRSWPSAGLGILLAGILLLIPYTQILVSNQLWGEVMDDRYVLAAKAAAEEFMELGAYLIMLTGSVEFLYSWSRLPQTRLLGALPKQRDKDRRKKSRNKKRRN